MNKVKELDYMRALATIAVIVIHICSPHAGEFGGEFYFDQMARFAVPMFLIISGCCLALNPKNEMSYPKFISHRFSKIFIPYVVWSAIYFVVDNGYTGDWGLFAFNLLTGRNKIHLYFVVIVMQLYLIYPLLAKMLKKCPKATLLATFAISLYCQIARQLWQFDIAILPQWFFEYASINIAIWIFYFVLGMFVAKNIGSMKKFKPTFVMYLFWFVTFIVLIYDTFATDTNWLSMKPSVMLYSVTTFFTLYFLFKGRLGKFKVITRPLNWISENSFVIYLSHVLFLEVFKSINFGTTLSTLTLFALTVVTSFLFAKAR